MALTLGFSVAVATDPSIQINSSDITLQQLQNNGGNILAKWIDSNGYTTIADNSNSTPFNGFKFQFQKNNSPSVGNVLTDQNNIYEILPRSAESNPSLVFTNNSGKGLKIGSSGMGDLTMSFALATGDDAPTGATAILNFNSTTQDNGKNIALYGNLVIQGGYSNTSIPANPVTHLRATFGGDLKGNITQRALVPDTNLNGYTPFSNITFQNSANLDGALDITVGGVTLIMGSGKITGNVSVWSQNNAVFSYLNLYRSTGGDIEIGIASATDIIGGNLSLTGGGRNNLTIGYQDDVEGSKVIYFNPDATQSNGSTKRITLQNGEFKFYNMKQLNFVNITSNIQDANKKTFTLENGTINSATFEFSRDVLNENDNTKIMIGNLVANDGKSIRFSFIDDGESEKIPEDQLKTFVVDGSISATGGGLSFFYNDRTNSFEAKLKANDGLTQTGGYIGRNDAFFDEGTFTSNQDLTTIQGSSGGISHLRFNDSVQVSEGISSTSGNGVEIYFYKEATIGKDTNGYAILASGNNQITFEKGATINNGAISSASGNNTLLFKDVNTNVTITTLSASGSGVNTITAQNGGTFNISKGISTQDRDYGTLGNTISATSGSITIGAGDSSTGIDGKAIYAQHSNNSNTLSASTITITGDVYATTSAKNTIYASQTTQITNGGVIANSQGKNFVNNVTSTSTISEITAKSDDGDQNHLKNTTNILSLANSASTTITITDINKKGDIGGEKTGYNYIGKDLLSPTLSLVGSFNDTNWHTSEYQAQNVTLDVTNLYVSKGRNYINVGSINVSESIEAVSSIGDEGRNNISTATTFEAKNISADKGINNIYVGTNATISGTISSTTTGKNNFFFKGENATHSIVGDITKASNGQNNFTLLGNNATLTLKGQTNQIAKLVVYSSPVRGVGTSTIVIDATTQANNTSIDTLSNGENAIFSFNGMTNNDASLTLNNSNHSTKTIFSLKKLEIKDTSNGNNTLNLQSATELIVNDLINVGDKKLTINLNNTDTTNVVLKGGVTTNSSGASVIDFQGKGGSIIFEGKENTISTLKIGSEETTISLVNPENNGTTPRQNRRSLTINSLDTARNGKMHLISQANETSADVFIINGTNQQASTHNLGVVFEDGINIEKVGQNGAILVARVANDSGIEFEKTGKEAVGFTIADITYDTKSTDSNGVIDENGNYTSYYILRAVGDEVILAEQAVTATAFMLNYDLYMANLNSLNKRMGELRENTHSQGAWARVFNGAQSNTQGLGSKSNYTTIQAGYDYAFGSEGANNYLGVALSYALSTSKTSSKALDSMGQVRGIDNIYSNAVEIALYNSYVSDSGWYNDSIAKFSYLMSSFDIANANTNSTTSNNTTNFAFTLGDEVGYKFALGEDKEWSITPQIEATFGYFNQSDFKQTLSNSTAFLGSIADAVLTLRTRVGSAFSYDFKKFIQDKGFNASVYVGAFYEYDYVEGGNITMSTDAGIQSNQFSDLSSDGRVVMNVGTNMSVKDNTRIYFDFEKSFAGKINTDYQVNVGVRYSFGESNGYAPKVERVELKAPLKVEGEESGEEMKEEEKEGESGKKKESKESVETQESGKENTSNSKEQKENSTENKAE